MNRFAFLLALPFAAAACDPHHGHDHGPGGHDHGKPAAKKDEKPKDYRVAEEGVKPYPFDVCMVSGEKLGSMGEPKRIVHEGQEILFCCPPCEEDFTADPAKFMKQIEEGKPPTETPHDH